jgi:simple sugar transport system ATP-binding protein
MDQTALLEMVGIEKGYGRVRAVTGIDMVVGYDEVIGLVGDNGAGKSTLIKVLSGVYPPDAGKIFWEGTEVHLGSPRDAMQLGIETIYQEPALIEKVSIMRNIFMGREPIRRVGPLHWLETSRMARESVKALEGVGLELRSPHAIVEQLSGGQRQGVAIARAMYFKTKLMILDEPTNNLSVKESHKILKFVSDLKAQGIASIFITHNLQHVYPVADRIIVLSHGTKVGDFRRADTSVEELTSLIVAG